MKRKIIETIFVLSFFLGCARTQVAKDIDAESKAQPARAMHGEVAARGMEVILQSPSLSEEQKERFVELHQQMMAKTFKIQNEISKLKGILFESIVSPSYNAEKIDEIKKRLITLNNERMSNMLNALKEVQTIVGYVPPEERRAIMREFIGRHNNAL